MTVYLRVHINAATIHRAIERGMLLCGVGVILPLLYSLH